MIDRGRWTRAGLVVCAVLLCAAARAEGPPGSSIGDANTPYMGLAFSADAQLLTGATTTAIPIEVPPGRAGMKPNLTLGYSSTGGPTPYGFGWDLPLGMVTRSTRLGTPNYDLTDTFIVSLPDGAVEVLPLSTSGNITTYAARIDESHIKVTSDATHDVNKFTVRDKSGRVYTFGGTQATLLGPNDAEFQFTFAWYLTSVVDPNGNIIEITYTKDEGVLYPLDILYGRNTSSGAGLPGHLFKVHFEFVQNTAPFRQRETYSAGFQQILDQRLTYIEVSYLPGAPTTLVRRYLFVHVPGTNGYPMLQTVAVQGTDGAALELDDVNHTTATTTFDYYLLDELQYPGLTNLTASGQNVGVVSGCKEFVGGRGFADINGDGLVDFIRGDEWLSSPADQQYWNVYLNQSNQGSGTPILSPTPVRWKLPKIFVQSPQGTIGNGNPNKCPTQTFGLTMAVALIDMNGDHLPDYVDSRSDPWVIQYNEGCDGNLTNCRFSSTYVTLDGNGSLRSGEQNDHGVWKDLIDMNGDGLPDIVSSFSWPTNGHKWMIRWNNGTDFSDPVPISTPNRDDFRFLRHFIIASDDRQRWVDDFFDINGDGLADKVIAVDGANRHWDVYYFTGTTFVGPFEWTNVPRHGLRVWQDAHDRNGEPCEENCSGPDCVDVCPLVAIYDVVDVTADGLPDIVDAQQWTSNVPTWRVYRNNGSGFDPWEPYTAPFPHPIRYQGVVTTFGGSWETRLTQDFFDINGDGFPDFVNAANEKVFLASIKPVHGPAVANETFRPDTLREIKTALGSKTAIRYERSTLFNTAAVDPLVNDGDVHLPFPHWVVKSLARSGLDRPTDVITTTYTYDGGYWDGGRREFRGFARATVTDSYGVKNRTEFHQTDVLRGKVKASIQYTGADPNTGLLLRKDSTWLCQGSGVSLGPCPSSASASPGTRYFPVLRQIDRTDASSNADSPWVHTTSVGFHTQYSYDECGNVTQDLSTDDVTYGTSPNTMRSDTSYKPGCNASLKMCDAICDRPATVSILGGLSKDMTYDERGNLKSVRMLGEGNPTTSMDYDAAGNLIRTIDPRGTRTTVDYDLVTKIYKRTVTAGAENPTQIKHPLITVTEFDPRFGKLLKTTAPNLSDTINAYDTFGRLTAIFEPGTPAGTASKKFTYVIGETQGTTLVPYRVTTETYEPNRTINDGYLSHSAFFDGLGRMQQVQTTQEVQGAEKIVVNNAKAYQEDGGRVVQEFFPIVTTLQDSGIRFTSFTGKPAAVQTYDAFGRVTARLTPDAALTTATNRKARVDRKCDALGALSNAGACKELEVDGFGRLVQSRTYSGNSTGLYAYEDHRYDAAGRETAVSLNGAPSTTIVTEYDALGRRKRVIDPSSGTWVFAYDLNGNLVSQDDPVAGQHLTYRYDPLNRMRSRIANVQKPQGNFCRALAVFQYDTSTRGKGRLSRVDDQSGSTLMHRYDGRGNPEKVEKTIRFGSVARTFVSEREFDELSRTVSETIPYTSLAVSETIHYSYSPQGMLEKVRSDHGAYVRDVDHDEFGRVTRMLLGNGAVDTRTYRAANGSGSGVGVDTGGSLALHGLRTVGPTNAVLRDVSFTDYDPNGKVLALADNAASGFAGPVSVAQTVSYADTLSRLTSSDQSGGDPGSRVGSYAYDNFGRIQQKDGESYLYNPSRPHQLSSVGGEAVAYNANGDMTLLPADRMLTYDADGKLVQVLRGGYYATSYAYDHAGARVVARDIIRGTTTFFFGSFDLYPDEGRIVRHFSAGSEVVASSPKAITTAAIDRSPPAVMLAKSLFGGLVAMSLGMTFAVPGGGRRGRRARRRRSSAALVAALVFITNIGCPSLVAAQCPDPKDGPPPLESIFYHLDRLGGPQLITDAVGAVLERVVSRPYGESGAYDASGGVKSQSAGAFGYTGHRVGDSSGLIYMNARFYDPALAMFVSIDPIRSSMSPYGYGGNDPINARDPTGMLTVWDVVVALIIYVAVVATTAAVASIVALANGASASDALKAAGNAAASSAINGAIGLVGGLTMAAVAPALAEAMAAIGTGMSAINAFAAAVGHNWEGFAVGVASLAVGMTLGTLLRDTPENMGENTISDAERRSWMVQELEQAQAQNLWTPENEAALARLLTSESSVGTAEEQWLVGSSALNRMQRNGTTDVGDVAGAYADNQAPQPWARELARGLLDGSIPRHETVTHFYSPRGMPREGQPIPPRADVRGGLEQTPGLATRNYRPSWAQTFRPVPGDNVRPSFFRFYAAPGTGPTR